MEIKRTGLLALASAATLAWSASSVAFTTAPMPTQFDQYMLELVNDLRANPQGWADTYLSGNLNEGLAAGTLGSGPRQPLAWDPHLFQAAYSHSRDMLDNDFFDHQGSDGSSPHQRMANAGYPFTGASGSGENLAARGDSTFTSVTTSTTKQLVVDLFVDTGISGRGHRLNLLQDNFENVGISVQFDPSWGGFGSASFPSVIATQDFAYNSEGPYLTGVAFDDSVVDDDFYTPGEGLAGLDVVVKDQAGNVVGTTTTINTGGWQLALPAGTYDVLIDGRLAGDNVSLGSAGVKVDYVAAVPLPPAVLLFGGAIAGLAGLRKKQEKSA